ncbi:MAG TPA: 2-dehydropantoate 2-reductase N-terminal domain-containing protein [Pseudomonadales bacterium]
MRFIVYGAGGIGGTIGARLHQCGRDVVLIARGEHGAVLARDGLTLRAPDGVHRLRIPTVLHPRELDFRPDDVVILAMKSQHTAAALEELLAQDPGDVAVVCAQNGVANERMALRRFRRVYAMLVHLPAMHLEPGEVVTHAAGRGGILDTGRYPSGVDETCRLLTAALRDAGFSAEPDPAVMRLKYAKLLTNLNNALQAAVQPAGSEFPPEAREISRRLKHEGLACFAAAGIDCASADEVRRRHEGVYHLGEVPGHPRGGGSSWQSVVRGTGNIETDYLNGEIVLLGRLHGIPTPANEVCQALARRIVDEGLGVGAFPVQEVLESIRLAEERPHG